MYVEALQRDLPWLQDTPGEHVWSSWAPQYRDLIILDATNRKIAVFNLTEHDLDFPDEVDALRRLLLDATATVPR